VEEQWRAGGLRFSESVYAPGAVLSRHTHLHPYFCILLHGSYRETYRHGVRECRAASTLLHPPGEVHEDHFLEGGGRIFRFEIVESEPRLLPAARLAEAPDLRGGKVRCLAARLYRESRSPDHFSPLVAEALALEIIGEATRGEARRDTAGAPGWLARATELLHEALPGGLTVARLAEIVGVHPVHLARVFRRRHGCSIGEYARNWRVEIASSELATTTRPVAEVAAIAGFADQSHLCRTFKAASGLTPNEYRAVFRR
jgi:AraC family transcriptional regulator